MKLSTKNGEKNVVRVLRWWRAFFMWRSDVVAVSVVCFKKWKEFRQIVEIFHWNSIWYSILWCAWILIFTVNVCVCCFFYIFCLRYGYTHFSDKTHYGVNICLDIVQIFTAGEAWASQNWFISSFVYHFYVLFLMLCWEKKIVLLLMLDEQKVNEPLCIRNTKNSDIHFVKTIAVTSLVVIAKKIINHFFFGRFGCSVSSSKHHRIFPKYL